MLKHHLAILTDIEGADPLAAWRMYNQGARVEHRIEDQAARPLAMG